MAPLTTCIFAPQWTLCIPNIPVPLECPFVLFTITHHYCTSTVAISNITVYGGSGNYCNCHRLFFFSLTLRFLKSWWNIYILHAWKASTLWMMLCSTSCSSSSVTFLDLGYRVLIAYITELSRECLYFPGWSWMGRVLWRTLFLMYSKRVYSFICFILQCWGSRYFLKWPPDILSTVQVQSLQFPLCVNLSRNYVLLYQI